jgi:hypothetical protein
MTTSKNTISHRTGVSTFASPTSPSTGQSLQKSFHLSHADKIELKKISSPSENKKYATAQPNDRQKSVAKQTPKPLTVKRFNYWVDRRPACNTGLAKVAVLCSADTFVVNQSLVLRINICGENRHLRQARNRVCLESNVSTAH